MRSHETAYAIGCEDETVRAPAGVAGGGFFIFRS
jgi:hypothetical protein